MRKPDLDHLEHIKLLLPVPPAGALSRRSVLRTVEMKSHRMTNWALSAAVGLALSSTASASAKDDEAVATAQRQLLDKYCITCHNYTDYAGKLEFEIYDPAAPQE